MAGRAGRRDDFSHIGISGRGKRRGKPARDRTRGAEPSGVRAARGRTREPSGVRTAQDRMRGPGISGSTAVWEIIRAAGFWREAKPGRQQGMRREEKRAAGPGTPGRVPRNRPLSGGL